MMRRPVVAPISALMVAAGLTLVPSGCARNPVTGKNELSLVSESQEIEMGKESAQQVAAVHRLLRRSGGAGVRRPRSG